MENRRKYFRITYPIDAGPKLVYRGVPLTVVNLSEQGLRFQIHNLLKFKEGQSFSGSLSFASGETFLVFGSVRRVDLEGIGIELTNPIPLKMIMAEQRRLIQNFPKRA